MEDIWAQRSPITDDQLRWILTHCININRLDLGGDHITNRIVEQFVDQIKKRTQRVIMSSLCRNDQIPKDLDVHNIAIPFASTTS